MNDDAKASTDLARSAKPSCLNQVSGSNPDASTISVIVTTKKENRMRILIPVLMVALALAGCGSSSTPVASAPMIDGTYTGTGPRAAHASVDVAAVGTTGYHVVVTLANGETITGTAVPGEMSYSDDGKHSLFIAPDNNGGWLLDVDHIRYYLHQSA